jgi:hypothetical protein
MKELFNVSLNLILKLKKIKLIRFFNPTEGEVFISGHKSATYKSSDL